MFESTPDEMLSANLVERWKSLPPFDISQLVEDKKIYIGLYGPPVTIKRNQNSVEQGISNDGNKTMRIYRKVCHNLIYEGTGGYAREIREDGSLYQGGFGQYGRRSGKGKLIEPNGDVYEGEFYDDEKHGKGRLVKANQEVQEGEFRYDYF